MRSSPAALICSSSGVGHVLDPSAGAPYSSLTWTGAADRGEEPMGRRGMPWLRQRELARTLAKIGRRMKSLEHESGAASPVVIIAWVEEHARLTFCSLRETSSPALSPLVMRWPANARSAVTVRRGRRVGRRPRTLCPPCPPRSPGARGRIGAGAIKVRTWLCPGGAARKATSPAMEGARRGIDRMLTKSTRTYGVRRLATRHVTGRLPARCVKCSRVAWGR